MSLEFFNEKAAYNHVKSLEFKRLAATEGEIKAINYIKKELDKNQIDYKIESFNWSKSYSILTKAAFIFLFFYLILYQWIIFGIAFIWTILILDIILVFIIIIFVKKFLDFSRIIQIGKRNESKNIYAKIQSNKKQSKKPLIIFSAHYDSISIKYPYHLQIILYISGAFLVLSYLIITFLIASWYILDFINIFYLNDLFYILRDISLIIGIIIGIIIILIILNKRTNESFGSIDNATGVAILLELASLVKHNPLEKIDVIFLWCGAEEWGLWGSRQFCAKHFNELKNAYDLNKSYNINIDIVGSYIGLVDKTGLIRRKPLNTSLNDVLFSISKQQNIKVKKSYIPLGAGSDHMSFKAFAKKNNINLQVACFTSTKDAKWIHSKKDNSDKCSAKNLNDCIKICYN
ncbi:MAG: M28 family metallopeptidase, partial [Candidatus Helarchaeota archaeon]